MRRYLSLLCVATLCVSTLGMLPSDGLADTVTLRSGAVVEGTVADHGDTLRVVTDEGTISVRWREVDHVLRDGTLVDVFADRKADLAADDVRGLYELALWAGQMGLREEAGRCVDSVLEKDPEHVAARSLRKEQKVGDAWLSGSKLLEAKGFVAHEGRWVLREEAEVLARRAAAPKRMNDDEIRVSDLIQKAALGGERAAKFAREALAGMTADALARPALRALRRGTPEERVLAAELLSRWGDVDAVRPLIYAATMDRQRPVRRAAVSALKEIDHEDTVRPFARALWSQTPMIATHAAEALGAIGGGQSVEYLVRRVSSGGGPGGRNHIFVGRQISYISDFDVEIAQAAQIGDPIVGTIREGVILDTRVIGVREEYTTVERRAFYQALSDASGQDFGEDATAWGKWWADEGREALAAK